MKYLQKIAFFTVLFAIYFLIIRIIDEGDLLTITLDDLAGIPWLFSTIGLIFSILAGFVIQRLWDTWEKIEEVIYDEVHALRTLLQGVSLNQPALTATLTEKVQLYVAEIIHTEWHSDTLKNEYTVSEDLLRDIEAILSTSYLQSEDKSRSIALLHSLISIRQRRLRLFSRRLPFIIKNTLLLNTVMLVTLSVFVGVKNPLFDLLFTWSMSTLVFVIYVVIDDLDSLFVPGTWHVSKSPYESLLSK